LQPVDGLHPGPCEFFAAVDQHPQRLQLDAIGQHPQVLGADRDHRDRVRVVCVGLAVVPAIEQPGAGGELGGHVDHRLTVGQQPLRQRPAGAVTALDRPNPLRPGRDVFAHHGVAGLVGVEPASRQDSLAMVDDLDGRRQLMGIDPDEHLRHAAHSPFSGTDSDCEAGIATTSWAVPSGATPRHGTRWVRRPKESHTHHRVGSREESVPTEHLDRVWPDTGPRRIV
jgi:hypothetical protein